MVVHNIYTVLFTTACTADAYEAYMFFSDFFIVDLVRNRYVE